MKIDRVTATFAALVPTGSYSNIRIEVTAEAQIADGESALFVLNELVVKLRNLAREQAAESLPEKVANPPGKQPPNDFPLPNRPRGAAAEDPQKDGRR